MDRYTIETLETQGFDGTTANTYWTIGSSTLLVSLPGLGYTNDMPIMFYVAETARNRGYDVLQVNYDYRSVPRETSAEEWSARMMADVQPAIDAALAKGNYRNIILAGKSIGTRVMATLLARGFDKATAFIWLTPLFVAEPIRQSAMDHQPSIAIFGDADYAVQGVDFALIAKSGMRMIIQPEGDHGMMVPGNVPQSIADLANAMNELNTWMNEHIRAGEIE